MLRSRILVVGLLLVAVAVAWQASAQQAPEAASIVLILDGSGSMWGQVEGKAKMGATFTFTHLSSSWVPCKSRVPRTQSLNCEHGWRPLVQLFHHFKTRSALRVFHLDC